MSLSITITDADHRHEVYAEIESDGELVAEAFAVDGRMRISFVDLDGQEIWAADLAELLNALTRAHDALREAGLIE